MQDQLEYLKHSRELQLGLRLRQSWLFKKVRQYRLRDRLISVTVEQGRNPLSSGNQVWLLGVWYADYLSGMPLELLDRDLAHWQVNKHSLSPSGVSLMTSSPASLYLYTSDENLRLDFLSGVSCGRLIIKTPAAENVIDLFSPQAGVLSVYPNRQSITIVSALQHVEEDHSEEVRASPALLSSVDRFSPEDSDWLVRQQADPRPLSINHPEWRGILASSKQLFGNIFTIADDLDRTRATYFARLICEAGCPSITIQGFPLSYVHLVKAIRKIAPSLPIFTIYHGNYLHTREDYDWRSFQAIKSLHDQGDIRRVGFIKQGMAEVMAAAGIHSAFVMNLVREIPQAPSQPLSGGPHIGIWGQPDTSWKKPPYAMLAALKLIPGALGHVYNVSRRAQEYGDLLQVKAEFHLTGVPPSAIAETMAQMHVNLYVTLTECAPMMPLESLAAGAPCLLGPTSHYFKDNEYLFNCLVTPEPDNAQVIAAYTMRVLDERDHVIRSYQEYAPEYNRRALQALANFLASPDNQDA